MPREGHSPITIPTELYKRLKQHIKNSNGKYAGISHFTKLAVEAQIKKDLITPQDQ